MLRRDTNGYIVYIAALLCATVTILLGCVGSGRWRINDLYAGQIAAATATSPSHRTGVSGQRFRLRQWRDAPSLSSTLGARIEDHSILTAPLTRADGRTYPMCDVWAVILPRSIPLEGRTPA